MNVFNDSSQADTTGTLTSTSLTGLGLPGALSLGGGGAFGEGVRFAGGITYANVEELNIHLGTRQRHLHDRVHARRHDDVTGGRRQRHVPVKTDLRPHDDRERRAATTRVTVRNDEGIVDQIAGLLTIDTGAGNDLVTVDDAADTNNNTGTLTGSTLTGLDMPTSPLMQVIFIQAVGGRYRLERTDTHSFVELEFDATADQVAARAARAVRHAGPEGRDRPPRRQRHLHRDLHREAAGLDFAALAFTRHLAAGRRRRSQRVRQHRRCCRARSPAASSRRSRWRPPAAPTGCTSSAATRSPASCATTSTAPIAYNATEADVLAAVSAILNPNNTNPALPFTDNVAVRRYGTVYQLLFRGEDAATTIGWVDTSALTGTLDARHAPERHQLLRRRDARTSTLGSGNDVFNVQGTTATTNLSLGAGDERVYVSSGAAYGQADRPDYLYGNLDQILGALNIDAGSGRHQLMISDEAALVGDTDVRITDAPGSEILVSGLAPAPITFKAAANGTFADGVTIWTGSGADRIHVDATHERAGVRTVTSLNTGLGDDEVWVDLQAGRDGFFVLDTQGAYEHVYDGRRRHLPAPARRPRPTWCAPGSATSRCRSPSGPTAACACWPPAACRRRCASRSRAPTAQAFTVGAGGDRSPSRARRIAGRGRGHDGHRQRPAGGLQPRDRPS